MGKVIRDLVEYNGIATCPYTADNFKQINVDYILNIPIQKPDIEQIVKVWADTCIVEKKIVKTPVGVSLEGQKITGKKLLLCGDIKLKVEYVACDKVQSLHSTHTTFPFCTYIVLPSDFNDHSIVSASIMIEDISSEPMDLRTIYNNITMTAIADIC